MTKRWQQGHDMDLKHGKELHLPHREDLPRRFCISKLLYFATRSRLFEGNRRRHRGIFRTCNAGRSFAYATNLRDTFILLLIQDPSGIYTFATEVPFDVKRRSSKSMTCMHMHAPFAETMVINIIGDRMYAFHVHQDHSSVHQQPRIACCAAML